MADELRMHNRHNKIICRGKYMRSTVRPRNVFSYTDETAGQVLHPYAYQASVRNTLVLFLPFNAKS